MIFVLSACSSNKPCTALGTSIKDGWYESFSIGMSWCTCVPLNFQSYTINLIAHRNYVMTTVKRFSISMGKDTLLGAMYCNNEYEYRQN